jgi:hypothetical protein
MTRGVVTSIGRAITSIQLCEVVPVVDGQIFHEIVDRHIELNCETKKRL